MSTTTSYQSPRNPIDRTARARPSRWARAVWILAIVAAAVVGGNELLKASRSPGDAIRSELMAAAGELVSPPAYPTEAAKRAIGRHFSDHSAVLHTKLWPVVSVTLRHLDRAACVDASTAARRMEGLVVVELEGYRSAEDCGDDNDLTWRMLP